MQESDGQKIYILSENFCTDVTFINATVVFKISQVMLKLQWMLFAINSVSIALCDGLDLMYDQMY